MTNYTEEQKKILMTLAFMYWGAGDVKDVWNNDDPDFIAEICNAFQIENNEEAITAKLNELESIYAHPDNFTLKDHIERY